MRTVPVPLLPGDPDVPLDLQAALTTVYGIFGYDETIDYRPHALQLAPAIRARGDVGFGRGHFARR